MENTEENDYRAYQLADGRCSAPNRTGACRGRTARGDRSDLKGTEQYRRGRSRIQADYRPVRQRQELPSSDDPQLCDGPGICGRRRRFIA
ncbi:hypothetical protein D3C71_1787060 [compost metagenome]